MSHLRVTFLALLAAAVGLCAASGDANLEIAAPDGSTFRRDYKFNSLAGGWLKLHRVPAPWQAARLACYLEGARLASPLTHGLYSALRQLMEQGRRESLYTGLRTMYAEDDYYSVEGVHMTQMPLEWAEGEPDNRNNSERCLALRSRGLAADVNCNEVHAFVCYREKVGNMAVNECGNYDRQYVRKDTGSCYKVHSTLTTWFRANSVCTAEGGHLAIINSDKEAQILRAMGLERKVTGLLHIGFYTWYRDDSFDRNHWTTLDGKSLEEAGFARWRQGEPNNVANNEHCGSLIIEERADAQLNDLTCEAAVPFICEIETPRMTLW